jgi:hypothetical protein
MRLWSIHPQYLDRMGLLAVWREGLLARKVLLGETNGYRNHPQLIRFKAAKNPVATVSWYLKIVAEEAANRGYRFDVSKLGTVRSQRTLPVSNGQVAFEKEHLLKKLKIRDPQRYRLIKQNDQILLHPLFSEVPGPVAAWEKVPGR